MINDINETHSEIHMNFAADRHATQQLESFHDENYVACGCNHFYLPRYIHCKSCWELSTDGSQNNFNPSKLSAQIGADCVFPPLADHSGSDLKSCMKGEEIDNGRLDYSLPGTKCINKKHFTYVQGNGYYRQHKWKVRQRTKKASAKKFVSKATEGEDEEKQVLAEFQAYLSRLAPQELKIIEENPNKLHHDHENSKHWETDGRKKTGVLKCLSANSFRVQKPTESNQTSVQSKHSDKPPSRPVSFHGTVSLFGVSKASRDVKLGNNKQMSVGEDDDLNEPLDDDAAVFLEQHGKHSAWETSQGGMELFKNGRGSTKKIKSTPENIGRRNLNSEDRFHQSFENRHFCMMHASKSEERILGNTLNEAYRNTDPSLSNVSTQYYRDGVQSLMLPQFPLKRSPFSCKAKVHHLSALSTGPSLVQHLPKPLPPDFPLNVSSVDQLTKLNRPYALKVTNLASESDGSRPSFLQGRTMKAKASNRRVL